MVLIHRQAGFAVDKVEQQKAFRVMDLEIVMLSAQL